MSMNLDQLIRKNRENQVDLLIQDLAQKEYPEHEKFVSQLKSIKQSREMDNDISEFIKALNNDPEDRHKSVIKRLEEIINVDSVERCLQGVSIFKEKPEDIIQEWAEQSLLGFAQLLRGVAQLSKDVFEKQITENREKRDEIHKENLPLLEHQSKIKALPKPVFYSDKNGLVELEYKPYGQNEFKKLNYSFGEPPEYKKKFQRGNLGKESFIKVIESDKQVKFNRTTQKEMDNAIFSDAIVETGPKVINYLEGKHTLLDLVNMYSEAKVCFNIEQSFKNIGKKVGDDAIKDIAQRPTARTQKHMLKQTFISALQINDPHREEKIKELKKDVKSTTDYIDNRVLDRMGLKEGSEKLTERLDEFKKRKVSYTSTLFGAVQKQKEYFNRSIDRVQSQKENQGKSQRKESEQEKPKKAQQSRGITF